MAGDSGAPSTTLKRCRSDARLWPSFFSSGRRMWCRSLARARSQTRWWCEHEDAGFPSGGRHRLGPDHHRDPMHAEHEEDQHGRLLDSAAPEEEAVVSRAPPPDDGDDDDDNDDDGDDADDAADGARAGAR